MISAIHTETHRWQLFKKSEVYVTIELLKTPKGYGVHIYKDNTQVQNLTAKEAAALYRQMSQAIWGIPVDVVIDK